MAEKGITSEEMYEQLAEGIRKWPDQLQMMLDSIISMQKYFPMPRKGWEAFIRDIEYTNEKHGLNLVIKPELLEGPSINDAYEAFALSVNKGIEELSDDDKKKALLNSILDQKDVE